MASLTHIEKLAFEELFSLRTGYVMGDTFADATYAEFFRDTVKVNIADSKYALHGSSKAKRLRAFWELESDVVVGTVLKQLLEIWIHNNAEPVKAEQDRNYLACINAVERLLKDSEVKHYSLMVIAEDNAWEKREYIWHKSRILEYTSDEIREQIGSFSAENLRLLETYPILFMYETSAEGDVRVGKINRIQLRGTEVRILFEFDESIGVIPRDKIEALKWDLEIRDFEFSRTHWAVKNTDLYEVLRRVDVIKSAPKIHALEKFKADETLKELVEAIERDIKANKPAAALDRLHTYCMKKFAHLLEKRGIECDKKEPLHSRIGKYVYALEQERALRKISKLILKRSNEIFQHFNDIRNDASLAHDNELIEPMEARFIFETISSILNFIKAIEAERFDEDKVALG